MSRKYIVKVNNKAYEVEVEEIGKKPVAAPPPAPTGPKTISVTLPAAPAAPAGAPMAQPVGAGQKAIPAPMTGTIIKIMCQVGQEVKEGDVLLKLEAMKMETTLSSPLAGTIAEIRVKERQNVTAGEALVVLS